MPADSAALPKYLALSEYLIREVAAGRLPPGSRLPPERDFAEQLGVAVGTLRKALARLQEAGMIETIQGSGNYIRSGSQGSAIYAFFRLERLDGGGLPRARLLALDRIAPPSAAGGPDGFAAAWRIRRLRLLDDLAVAAEEIWLDAARAAELRAGDLSESLYLHYRERLGFWIAAIEDKVGLGRMPGWATATGLAEGAPCGRFDRVSRDQDGRVAEKSRTWFNTDRAVYVARG